VRAPTPIWRKLLAPRRRGTLPRRRSATYGGFAFAKEYDIERKWREARLYQTRPISTNLISPISASSPRHAALV